MGPVIIKIPFHNQLFVSIHMHMPRRVIPLPPNKDVPAPAEFTHSGLMLPPTVACVNLVADNFRVPCCVKLFPD